MKVQILIDNKNSWIVDYMDTLIKKIVNLGHSTSLIYHSDFVEKGDVLFLLSCENIFKNLELNKHNIVIHESRLPEGKGFSPMTWQIIEGNNKIPISLFEANSSIDSGKIYFQETINFDGSELIDQIRKKQGNKTIELVLKFIKNINNLKTLSNVGKESFFRKRDPSDSLLDINKTINEQFNLLRVVDNNRYPAYFKKGNTEYIIKIFKKKEDGT
tara:strand:- start:633 stop:1277 length:645 start_codon:yes stop_codon:yes gene_type:complete